DNQQISGIQGDSRSAFRPRASTWASVGDLPGSWLFSSQAERYLFATLGITLLLLEPRYRAQIGPPALRRAKPNLSFGRKLIALSRGPDAEGDMLPASDGSRADRRSTFRTKHLNALVTAFSRLDV